MNFRILALGAVLGFAVAVVPSCGPTACNTSNCKGCCDSTGKCQADPSNKTNTTCGGGGTLCQNCTAAAKVCDATTLQCVTSGTGGSGGSGGGTGTGGMGGSTGCTGCLSSGTCVARATSISSVTSCGIDGAMCAMCASGQLCTNGVCVTPDAGAGIGAPCTRAADCTGVTDTIALPRICRTKTFAGLTYPGGYCTRGCDPFGDDAKTLMECGPGAGCFAGISQLNGEIQSLCLKNIMSPSECRDGYQGFNFGTSTAPDAVCIPTLPDGGVLPPDAGPPSTTGANSPCMTDSQCGPLLADGGTEWFQCIPETLADGGLTGFTGGSCTGDCTIAQNGAFCGPNSRCLFVDTVDTASGPIPIANCFGKCDANNMCRTGYHCVTVGSSGVCVQNCNAPGGSCPQGRTCNMTTGACM